MLTSVPAGQKAGSGVGALASRTCHRTVGKLCRADAVHPGWVRTSRMRSRGFSWRRVVVEAASPRAVISGRTHARTHSMVSCVGRSALVDGNSAASSSRAALAPGWRRLFGWIFERRPEGPARPLSVVLDPEMVWSPHLPPRRCRRTEPTIGGPHP
eukprot:scaffold42594_cov64-Phaeocystis_antarctica.AAC.6